MAQGSKQQYKQFTINSLEDALLVLSSLIIPVTIDLGKFKVYSDEAVLLRKKYKTGDMIPVREYDDVHDKTLYQQRELLRFIADHQSSSFSYIDLRDHLVKRGFLDRSLEVESQKILTELLNIRNWSFHNAQSMMVAEKEITMRSIPKEIADMVEIKPQLNPIIIRKITEYPVEHLDSFILHNVTRATQFEAVLTEMKKDYQSMYDSLPDAQFMMVNGKLSKEVQFMEYEMRFDLHGIDSSIASLSMGIQKGKFDGSEESYKDWIVKDRIAEIEEELKVAQEILDNNPVLEFSPGDLRREGKNVEEWLKDFTEEEKALYRDYYSDEL